MNGDTEDDLFNSAFYYLGYQNLFASLTDGTGYSLTDAPKAGFADAFTDYVMLRIQEET